MLDNDNIICTSVSEAVEKIRKDENIITNVPLGVLLCTATAYKDLTNIQLTVEIVVYLLGYIHCS